MDDFWGVAVPTWLTGVGTVGLATFALLSIRGDRAEREQLRQEARDERDRANRIETEGADREADRLDRAQAEAVVAWAQTATRDDEGYTADPPSVLRFASPGPGAFVRNYSLLPISNVNIAWCDPRGSAVLETRNVRAIGPQGQAVYARPPSLQQQPPDLPVEIDFRDVRGIAWKRDRDGTVTKLG